MSVFTEDQIQQLAHALNQSEKSRVQIEHFSKRYPGMTIEDGYRINRAWMQIKFAEGRTLIGHKIGLTSRAMQVSSQIDEPDYGTLLDDMLYTCTPGQVLDIPFTHFIAPRVEVELAFILKKELRGPHVTVQQVLEATDYVTPAIEIIDSRIEQFDRHTKVMRKVYDTISDNAANAGIVLGAKRVDPLTTDLPWCGAVLRQNGVVEETGLAAGVQGHPAVGIAWLVIVAAEMLTGGTGIGFWLWDEWNNLKVEHIVIAIFLIGVVGLMLEHLLIFIAKQLSYEV